MELGLKSGPKSHGGVEWVLSTFWVGIAETKAGPGAAKSQRAAGMDLSFLP